MGAKHEEQWLAYGMANGLEIRIDCRVRFVVSGFALAMTEG